MSDDELLDCSASELNFCQQLHYKRNCKDACDQVDGLRCYMRQLLHSQKMGSVSLYAADYLLSECAGQYMSLMDSSDTISGVRNYAEEALSLARLKKTEIDRFESSLTVDSVALLPSIKTFFTNQQNKCTKNESTKGIAAFIETLQSNRKMGLDQTVDGHHGCEIVQNSSSKYERSHRLVPQSSVDVHNINSSCSRHVSPRPTQCSLRNTTNLVPMKDFSSLNSGEAVVSGEPDHTAKRPSVTFVLSDYRAGGTKRKHYNVEPNEDTFAQNSLHAFRTAREQLILESNKPGSGKLIGNSSNSSNVLSKKSLGTRRGGVYGKFIPPLANREPEKDDRLRLPSPSEVCDVLDDRLKNIDEKMIELIKNEIMDHGPTVFWNDIAGLEFVKKTVKEIVVLPMLRPDIFTGLRGPPKGLLLFGPPGTGKTLIGKCIASNSKSTFFSISASSLTSKWIGEGEKMVRALFAVARCHQPAVVFIDEIDSLLTQRSDTEHESSRRMKTEFLVQLDGATTNQEDKLLVVGATNRPQELDEAARRRLVKRLYVPLPELEARMHIIFNLMNSQKHGLKDEHIRDIAMKTEGYSGADMANLCKEASLGPIRCLSFEDIEHISAELVRPISYEDFLDALHQVKASVSENDLRGYVEWNNMFGSTSKQVQAAPKTY